MPRRRFAPRWPSDVRCSITSRNSPPGSGSAPSADHHSNPTIWSPAVFSAEKLLSPTHLSSHQRLVHSHVHNLVVIPLDSMLCIHSRPAVHNRSPLCVLSPHDEAHPDTHATGRRPELIPNLHSPYYCDSDIYPEWSSEEACWGRPQDRRRTPLIRPCVTEID